jgi:Fic family protein
VIEGVFSLEGSSWPRLVRRGFFVNSIEGISRDSKLKKKTTIIRVLENTLEALNKMSTSLDDFALFTPEFLMELHRMLLQNDNFVIEEVDENPVYQVIPLGKFRVRACITEHGEDEDVRVTQFCHPSLIYTEMERYCKLARYVLANDSIDVFMKTAWLQWAFLHIHPFADGNGRISRIISSIPLCKLGLPPVVVTMACKPVYFAALHQADTEKNLLPLSAFLRSSILETITEIANLPTDAVLSAGKTQARIRITPRVRRAGF